MLPKSPPCKMGYKAHAWRWHERRGNEFRQICARCGCIRVQEQLHGQRHVMGYLERQESIV